MPVRIRLARAAGYIRRPIYRIRVQDSKAPRDGKFIEEIGTYYPVAESQRDQTERLKVMRLEHERAKYWLSVGAQPTPAVARLLAAANVIPTPPRPNSVKTRLESLQKAADEADE